jgi:hypothetical protein
LFSDQEKYNAGLFGVPPYFDLGSKITELWKDLGSPKELESAIGAS